MSKLVIVDIDGVIANSDVRFAQATDATTGKVNWSMALNGAHVHLDVPIDGAATALDALEQQGYTVVLLTSRPDHMRAATIDWFRIHGIKMRRLMMKPASAQYTKTKVWKAQEVGKLVAEFGVSDILLIEDESANVEEIVARNSELSIRSQASLDGTTPPPSPEKKQPTTATKETWRCLSCGTAFNGRHCPRCGDDEKIYNVPPQKS